MEQSIIHKVDRSQSQSLELLGSKPKFWFLRDNHRWLFKADDRGTGEDWAEVIASKLCRLLGLPHVEYHLAAEFNQSEYLRPGVICENMAETPKILVLGNQLLFARDPQYPRGQRFKLRQHTVEVVAEIVDRLAPPAIEWEQDFPVDVKSALDVFAGYIMLDAWIANQDRHHENWGAIWDGSALRLSPTFDHGAAMARNLTDADREARLRTKDHNRSVAIFAKRARSAFFASPSESRSMLLDDAWQQIATIVPAAAKGWLNKLASVQDQSVARVFDHLPTERMSAVCKEFTLELLLSNQQRLLNLGR
ncbi:MAG: phosphatidylinositol kinase [Planctomycetota bacterium]|nr:phosphatidylinositol kinase [Planctomycetota bacterium]